MGVIINVFLFGVMATQCFIYYSRYPKYVGDPTSEMDQTLTFRQRQNVVETFGALGCAVSYIFLTRSQVGVLLILDIVNVVFDVWWAYDATINKFGLCQSYQPPVPP